MIDDILEAIFGDILTDRLGKSKRAQLIFRVFFGILGAVLGLGGLIHFIGRDDPGGNIGMQLSMIGVFGFLSCFSLFNIAFARKWRWPGIGFIISFVIIFITRILFGA